MSDEKKPAKETSGIVERLCVKGWDTFKGNRDFPYSLDKREEALAFAQNWCRNGGEQTRLVRERSSDGLSWKEVTSEPIIVPRYQLIDV